MQSKCIMLRCNSHIPISGMAQTVLLGAAKGTRRRERQSSRDRVMALYCILDSE